MKLRGPYDALLRFQLSRLLSQDQISTFIRLCSLLKRDIMQPQPIPETSSEYPPAILPACISTFLGDTLDISSETVSLCWKVFKQDVWDFVVPDDIKKIDLEVFRIHGWKRGLTYYTVYPPSLFCTNTSGCDRTTPLKQEKMRQVVLFTLTDGVQPAWAVNLVCPNCNTSYHNNFSVNSTVRTYYEGIPRYIQVGEHQFVEERLADSWIGMMLLGWFSASNAAAHYNKFLSGRDHGGFPEEWQFAKDLSMDHVWDAFIIKSLLEDHYRQDTLLQVSHDGNQDRRFHVAMQERNHRIVRLGQSELLHACDKCLRIFQDGKGEYKKAQVLVCDGLSIGHPCCSKFRCTQPLERTKDRFCPAHAHLLGICAVKSCEQATVKGRKTCANPVHQEMENKHHARGEAFFALGARARKQNQQDVEDDNEWFEVDGNQVQVFSHPNAGSTGQPDTVPIPCDTKSEEGNRKHTALFSRSRTHNEQILVRPCGIIHSRATFYGAEAVSNFFVKAACSVPGAHKPELLVYDTACLAAEQISKGGDPWWDDIGLVVDVFHFENKHKTTHEFCQKYCNPALFPEMVDPENNKWWFNTSAAEQVNVWLGKYQAIVKEMNVVKYNFFLDEMIMRHNEEAVTKLQAMGYNPHRLSPSS
ncbi:hypothetical protein K435DRAFT_821866 [Dendrothele bispora CBS 962.96]|uniref:CxC5 like cysteine cluster associated with KDZ domain-containing protein n=1 Tax=Dendrothele bispora (strain CBS 962.96) TaxID=1314807 RepID=A0A4S8LFE8_DENBC|nr:hypothetical protein K435DRAFT_821866 [Dendrothele bispora CBS 962.96]